MLNKDGELILKKEEFASIFNDCFGSIVGNLNKEQWNRSSTASSISNRLNDAMVIIKSHINCPNIKKIREKYKSINKFVFRSLASDEVKKIN